MIDQELALQIVELSGGVEINNDSLYNGFKY